MSDPKPDPIPPAEAPPAEQAAPPGKAPEMSPADCAAQLAARFPALFGTERPQPIKLRIQADIQQRAPGVFTRKTLSLFLHRHTTSTAYLRALVAATQRVDLNGAPAGDIADEHRAAAQAELERRQAIVAERRAAERAARAPAPRRPRDGEPQRAARGARPKPQAPQRPPTAPRPPRPARPEAAPPRPEAALDADTQARRERAALLRAWESSPLTKANFCALKRIAEAELDAALAMARQEHGGPSR